MARKNRETAIRLFKLYKHVKGELQMIEIQRGGRFGIAARPPQDELAKEWQSKRMRLEIIEAYLEGRNPNWFNAPYLTVDESIRRNNLYITNSNHGE